MKFEDTVPMMLSEDYKERFKAEYYQLSIRIEGLYKMLVRYRKGTLDFTPKCSHGLLRSQLDAMNTYALYLEERADIEGIKLED